jgi:peptidoglycan/xylan/chitin deacetylase (PgdA/CDA1 family)
MKRAYDMGCDIENHSFSHPAMSGLSEEELIKEIESTSALIEKYTGEAPQFFRPPYIDCNQKMMETIPLTFICGHGCEDWLPEVSAQERARRQIEAAVDGRIMLLHDMPGNDNTVEALDIIIPELKKQGYRFVTISELFKLKNEPLTPHSCIMYSVVPEQQ